MSNLKIVLVLFSLILFASCKEEKDEIPPRIEFTSPPEGKTFNVFDEVEVRATITDNELIKSVTLSLISYETNNQVMYSVSYSPNSSKFDLVEFYDLTDSLIKGGDYYFKITASDEENSYFAFKDVSINAFPKRKLGTIVATSNETSTQFYRNNTDFSFEQMVSFSSPYQGSELNSFDQQLWVFSKKGNNFSAFDLRNNKEVFTETATTNTEGYFFDTDLNDRKVYVSNQEGQLASFNNQFNSNIAYSNSERRQLEQLKVGGKYIIQESVFLTKQGRKLEVIFKNSGGLEASIPTENDMIDAYFKEEDKALVFSNSLNGGVVYDLRINPDGLNELNTMNDSITSVERLDAETYLISTKKEVHRYLTKTNSIISYLDHADAICKYDAFSNRLHIGEGNTLYEYQYGNTTPINTALFNSPIVGIEIWLNY